MTTSLAPAFTVTFAEPITPFAIDEAAFDQWIAGKDPEDLAIELPSSQSEAPSRDRDRLIAAASEKCVTQSDPRLELHVFGDEDEDGSGYHVFVANRTPAMPLIQLSPGWVELNLTDPSSPAEESAREYLQAVIDRANHVLTTLTEPRRPSARSGQQPSAALTNS